MTSDTTRRPPGGRRAPRPATIETCSACREPVGWNYPSCPVCYEMVERIWQADWAALLDQEGITPGSEEEALLAQVTVIELDRHPWTIVDVAMSLTRCGACGEELGGGPPDCAECRFAFDNLWGYDFEAVAQGMMTANEHALRVARYVLRYPHRHDEPTVYGWRVVMPGLLTGAQPPSTPQAQRLRAMINDGWRGRVRPDWEPAENG